MRKRLLNLFWAWCLVWSTIGAFADELSPRALEVLDQIERVESTLSSLQGKLQALTSDSPPSVEAPDIVVQVEQEMIRLQNELTVTLGHLVRLKEHVQSGRVSDGDLEATSALIERLSESLPAQTGPIRDLLNALVTSP